MYRILQEEGIDLPRYAVLNRDPDKPEGQSVHSAGINSFQSVGVSHIKYNHTNCRSLK